MKPSEPPLACPKAEPDCPNTGCAHAHAVHFPEAQAIDRQAVQSPDQMQAVQGPRLVFFTGGTALRDLSAALSRHTSNSVHLVTPFDSGGSTAALRRAFAMPAMGDIRNRLLALADTAAVPEAVFHCCSYRFPDRGHGPDLRQALRRTGHPDHALWRHMPQDFARPLQSCLGYFLERMPEDFDVRQACMGNLMLAGSYLHHKRDFGPVLAFFSRLLHVRGIVQPIVEESLHLAAELVDGSFVVGQHLFRHLPAAVRRLFLTVHEPDGPATTPQTACRPPVSSTAAHYLRRAGAICYPMGSFYTSVLANLLPQGVGQAVAEARCPRIFIPNSGQDAELHGLSVAGQVQMLLRHLHEDAPQATTEQLLQAVLVDSRHGRYEGGMDAEAQAALRQLGVRVLDRDLVCGHDAQRHEPELTVQALLCLLADSGGVL